MSDHAWTEELIAPLAAKLRGRSWRMMEFARDKGWYFLRAESKPGRVGRWYHLAHPAAELVEVPVLDDAGLPQLPAVVGRWLADGYRVSLLAHKAGRRATFFLTKDDEPLVAKVYRKDRDLLRRWQLFPVRGEDRSGWGVPAVREWDEKRRTLLIDFHDLPALHTKWMNGGAEVVDATRIVELLGLMQGAPLPANFPAHAQADEIRILEERLIEYEATLARPHPGARDLQARVCAALVDDPRLPLVCGHRDLHDKQILPDRHGGVLIDLDLAAAMPAALDPGNVLAHLRLRALQAGDRPWREVAAAIAMPLLARSWSRTAGMQDSLYRWTAATLLRLALIYSRRQRPAHLIDKLLESTEHALGRCGEWQGVL